MIKRSCKLLSCSIETRHTRWLTCIFLSGNCTVQKSGEAKGNAGRGHVRLLFTHSRFVWTTRFVGKHTDKMPFSPSFYIQPAFITGFGFGFFCAKLSLNEHFLELFYINYSARPPVSGVLGYSWSLPIFLSGSRWPEGAFVLIPWHSHQAQPPPISLSAVCSSPLPGLSLSSADTQGLTRHLLKLRDPNSCWLISFFCE